MRISRSASSARGPTSAASSPAARRRARSIWKKRSCACRKPIARATSSRVAPLTVGMPSVSRVTITLAESPSSRSSPVRVGRLPRSSPRAHTTLAAAPMASKIAIASPTFHSRRRIVLIMVIMGSDRCSKMIQNLAGARPCLRPAAIFARVSAARSRFLESHGLTPDAYTLRNLAMDRQFSTLASPRPSTASR